MPRPGRQPETAHEAYPVYTIDRDGNVTPGHSLQTWRHNAEVSTAQLNVGSAGRGGLIGRLDVRGAPSSACSNRGKSMDGICPECEEPSVFHLHPARNGVVFGPLKAAIIRRRGSVDYLEYAQEPSSSKRVILIAEAWATTHGTLYTGAGTAWKCLKCGRQNEGSNSNSTIPPLRCPECHGDVIARFERDNSKVLTTGQISAARGSAIGVTVITRLARGEVLRQVQRGSENDTERYITWGDGWLSVVTSRSDRPLRRSTTTITKGEARSLRSALRSRLGKQFPDGINPVTGKGDPRAINPVTGEEIRGWFEGAVELDELRQRMPYKR